MTSNKMLGSTSVLLVLVLMIVTFGIYYPIWFLRRKNILNRLSTTTKLYSQMAVVLLILLVLTIPGQFREVFSFDETILGILMLITAALFFVSAILGWILAFRVRRMLDEHYNRDLRMEIPFSGLTTFFLTIYYLQYKMNRLTISSEQ
ncbi:MAG: DUF4234 domain-containing protein [Candidatus Scalindua sediminis]|nr:DUF4234 domain-containing protein [Candidatus Scalindua sediminis]